MKINLAVLFGGKSVEHEISIISALQAMQSLDKEKYEIFPIYITKNNELYYGEALFDIENFKDLKTVVANCEQVDFMVRGKKTYLEILDKKLFSKKEISHIDIAFPIVHGTNTEDGTIQGYLASKNLPFVGSDLLSSAIGMDKYVSKILLKEAGFPVLDGLMFNQIDYKEPETIVSKIEEKFNYPIIIKPINLGSSIGISKAKNAIELEEAITTAFSYATRILVEEAVVNIKEVNCSVLGDHEEAFPSILEEPLNSDEILSFNDKYVSGNKNAKSSGMASLKRKIPADVTPKMELEIKEIAKNAFQYLGFNGVVRVDFIIDTSLNKIYINEFNTIPGSLSFYLWEKTDLTYTQLLDKLIKLALKRQRLQDSLIFTFDSNVLSQSKGFGSKGSKGKA
ncbi:MAG: D-alanine--D-alanine ligase family protein [Lachnospirales bacterium]